ncbi:MAG: hypothetical protein QOE70_4342 [Chthoniobacter sp.]|jgi:hypothetical protein|nr:hypothetical protein [Chthoniobacter sp.]
MTRALSALLQVPSEPGAIIDAVHELLKKRYSSGGEFFLLSLKHSRSSEGPAIWWRADGKGYTRSLVDAGRYTAEEIAANANYNDGVNVVAIAVADLIEAGLADVPLDKAKALAERQVAA